MPTLTDKHTGSLTDHDDQSACSKVDTWQVSEVLTALQEANAGDFASDDDVAAVRLKWA